MQRTILIVGLALLAGWFGWTVLRSGEVDGPPVTVVAAAAEEEDEVADAIHAGAAADRAPDPGAAERPDRVSVEAETPALAASIRGRLLAPGGAVRAETTLAVDIIQQSGGQSTAVVMTDEDGLFVIPLVGGSPAGASLSLRDLQSGSSRSGARVVVQCAPGLAHADIGDVQLVGLTLVATGRVIDDIHRPIAGARVVIRRVEVTENKPITLTLANGTTAQVRMGNGNAIPRDVLMQIMQAQQEELQEETARLEAQLARALAEASSKTRTPTAESLMRSSTIPLVPDRIKVEELRARQARLMDSHRELREQFAMTNAPVAEAVSRADGTFELYAIEPQLPLQVRTKAKGHRGAREELAGLGAHVEIQLDRTAEVAGSALVPTWMPVNALEFQLVREGRTVAKADVSRTRAQAPLVEFGFGEVEPGPYEVVVHARNLPQPLRRLGPMEFLPGASGPDARLQHLDLTNTIHRYELRAVDERGNRLRDIPSPLLVHGANGEVVGFPWRNGKIELFAPTRTVDATRILAGYRAERGPVHAGTTDVVFNSLHPVEVVIPGLRARCGPDRRVRISMILNGSTGLPQGLRGVDQRSGEPQSYSRWHLSKSGGAWLGATDAVQVPLIRNGTYNIMIRLHEEGVGGDSSIDMGNHEVVLDGVSPSRVVLQIDPLVIDQHLANLRQRRGG